jgi:hypothetical protein
VFWLQTKTVKIWQYIKKQYNNLFDSLIMGQSIRNWLAAITKTNFRYVHNWKHYVYKRQTPGFIAMAIIFLNT